MGTKTLVVNWVDLFSTIPFVYGLVETPQQLLIVRVIHGLATAVFGPVSLAYVAEIAVGGRAERLGWFGMARSVGYLVAPTAAAWLLTWLDPATVFTVIGFTSCLAFLPVLMLKPTRESLVLAGIIAQNYPQYGVKHAQPYLVLCPTKLFGSQDCWRC
ncbi:MAG: hypothetical protein Ct9H300mP14_15430 [Gammaproteobacteria bacterium]|nr:MAG: hypothetical protein Ct9H300mP14_15430 [Gammaproteobacteria bacterium]